MRNSGGTPVQLRRRITPRQIAALVIIAVTVIFIVQNRDSVQIHLFALTLTSPLWLLLVVMSGSVDSSVFCTAADASDALTRRSTGNS